MQSHQSLPLHVKPQFVYSKTNGTIAMYFRLKLMILSSETSETSLPSFFYNLVFFFSTHCVIQGSSVSVVLYLCA